MSSLECEAKQPLPCLSGLLWPQQGIPDTNLEEQTLMHAHIAAGYTRPPTHPDAYYGRTHPAH